MDAPLRDQRLHPADVDGAPDAARLAGRKADGVTAGVDTPPDPVDPAEAERLIHGLRPGNARPAGPLLVVADHEFRRMVVMLLQPRVEISGALKECDVHTLFLL